MWMQEGVVNEAQRNGHGRQASASQWTVVGSKNMQLGRTVTEPISPLIPEAPSSDSQREAMVAMAGLLAKILDTTVKIPGTPSIWASIRYSGSSPESATCWRILWGPSSWDWPRGFRFRASSSPA